MASSPSPFCTWLFTSLELIANRSFLFDLFFKSSRDYWTIHHHSYNKPRFWDDLDATTISLEGTTLALRTLRTRHSKNERPITGWKECQTPIMTTKYRSRQLGRFCGPCPYSPRRRQCLSKSDPSKIKSHHIKENIDCLMRLPGLSK